MLLSFCVTVGVFRFERLIQTELNTQTFCAQAVSGTPTSPRGSRLRQQRHPMTSHCDMTHFSIHVFRNRGSNDNQAGLWTNWVDSVKSSNRTTVMTGRVWISWVSQRRSALQDKAEWKAGKWEVSSVTKNFSGETAIDDSYCSFLNFCRFNGCILMEIFPECSNTHDTCYLDRNL